jgi:NADH:ubiquinone oxidoreductase subunit 2 (subunit N)
MLLAMLPEIIVLTVALLILILDLFARRVRLPSITQGAFAPLAPAVEQIDALANNPARASAFAARPEQRRGLGILALVGMVLAALATIPTALPVLSTPYRPDPNNLITLLFQPDSFRLVFVWAFLMMTALTILLSLDRPWAYPAEYYVFLLASTLGMMFVAGAGELITLYISLELLSISQYILAAYAKGDTKSNEAGLKYLIIGAFSSAVLLYGTALLYGITGTTVLNGAEGVPGIAQVLPQILNQSSRAFLPNAPYIITDFIHVRAHPALPWLYWYDMVNMALLAWTGCVLGALSLGMIQRIVASYLGRALGWLFVLGTAGLCGCGIYLGRFARWNSWDLLTNPHALASDLLPAILQPTNYLRPLALSGLFAAFFLVSYLLLAARPTRVGTEERA